MIIVIKTEFLTFVLTRVFTIGMHENIEGGLRRAGFALRGRTHIVTQWFNFLV